MDPDSELLLRLRSGDERAFVSLVERYHEPMLRLAASFVPSGAVAEEVVQDTWLAVIHGLAAFEGQAGQRRCQLQRRAVLDLGRPRLGRDRRRMAQGIHQPDGLSRWLDHQHGVRRAGTVPRW